MYDVGTLRLVDDFVKNDFLLPIRKLIARINIMRQAGAHFYENEVWCPVLCQEAI